MLRNCFKENKGITLVSLVITVLIMTLLGALLVNAGNFGGLLNTKDEVESNFNETQKENDEKINSIRDQWGDVIDSN